MEEHGNKKQRIAWIDIAKFFGIVLVVIGHFMVVKQEEWSTWCTYGVIYSFHMPLFFILNFLTCSLSKSFDVFIKKTKQRAIHLLIPYLLILIVDVVVQILVFKQDCSHFSFWRTSFFLRLLGLEGDGYASMKCGWFFMGLFVGQTLFDFFHLTLKRDSLLLAISILLTLIGVIFGYQHMILPFDLDMVLSSFIFFFIGYRARRIDFNKYIIERLVICLLIWAALFTIIFTENIFGPSYYEVWKRRYPLFPLCHICAVAGSFAFIYLCVLFSKIKYIHIPFAFLGRYTSFMVIMHAFHQMYRPQIVFFPEGHQNLNDLIGISIGLTVVLMLIGLKLLYERFKSKHLEMKTA